MSERFTRACSISTRNSASINVPVPPPAIITVCRPPCFATSPSRVFPSSFHARSRVTQRSRTENYRGGVSQIRPPSRTLLPATLAPWPLRTFPLRLPMPGQMRPPMCRRTFRPMRPPILWRLSLIPRPRAPLPAWRGMPSVRPRGCRSARYGAMAALVGAQRSRAQSRRLVWVMRRTQRVPVPLARALRKEQSSVGRPEGPRRVFAAVVAFAGVPKRPAHH